MSMFLQFVLKSLVVQFNNNPDSLFSKELRNFSQFPALTTFSTPQFVPQIPHDFSRNLSEQFFGKSETVVSINYAEIEHDPLYVIIAPWHTQQFY